MAYFINQIHLRIDEDREIIRKIDELLVIYPGRWRTQSDVIRSAINYMHRLETEKLNPVIIKNDGGITIWERKLESANFR